MREHRPGTLDAICQGHLDPLPAVGKVIGLDEVPDALELTRRSEGVTSSTSAGAPKVHAVNAHFVRDIGAIQAGVGIGGIVGALRVRPTVVGLAGLLAFQVLHVASHVVDRDAGGRPGFDIPALSLVAAVTAVALVIAVRSGRESPSRVSGTA